MGERIETTAIIPTQPGSVILPEVRLVWWDVEKQQPELAVIPARVFQVAAPAQPPAPPSAVAPGEQPAVPAAEERERTPSLGVPPQWWPWISLGLILLWLLTLVMWVLNRRQSGDTLGTPGKPEPRVDARGALAELRSACRSRQAAPARDALLQWGAALWPDTPPRSLGELAARCGEPPSLCLRELEQVLYAHKQEWDSELLLEQITAFKPASESPPRKSAANLEPLYLGGVGPTQYVETKGISS